MPADVIAAPNLPRLKHTGNGRAVVLHMQPVAYVGPRAVHGQGLAIKGIADHQRNELFRELTRPVIVGAVGQQYRQAVCFVKCAHQMVAGGL